ncbi:MAG: hypothetical protein JNJ52_01370 [Flavobacterium sp.]|nr:hypothetical protein [Flavobacterium sp.]
MKKIYLILLLVFAPNLFFGQKNDTDSFIKNVKNETNSDKKIDLIISYFDLPANESELKRAKIAQKLLKYSYKSKDKIAETLALKEISYFYFANIKYNDGLKVCLKALKIAEKIKSDKLIGHVNIILSYHYNNFNKKNSLLQKSLSIATKNNDNNLKLEAYKTLSELYLDNNKITQSLYYSQKEYELTLKLKKFQDIGYTYLGFAEIHKKLRNDELALSYYNMAIKASKKINSKGQLGWSYYFKSQFFLDKNKIDSAKIYSQKSISAFDKTTQKSGYFRNAEILLDIYSKANIDSAYKYSEKLRMGIMDYLAENSSNDNLKIMLDEELRQKSLAEEKEELEEEKKQNIQYTLISIGILLLLSIYLIVSKSFIVSSKLIKYIGIVSLLIVFEFINLLIHPFLEKITHHSPILILLALVSIAAILVPLHHKVEHLFVAKMVEKNKKLKIKKAIEIINNSEENNSL